MKAYLKTSKVKELLFLLDLNVEKYRKLDKQG